MNRRLVGLLAAFCLLSACNKTPEPVGKLEPLPRPAGTSTAADPAAPATPPPAPPDASQVLLRWKLAAPTAYQLAVSGSTAAPAAAAPARKAKVRKSSRKKGAPEPEAESTPSPAAQALTTFFLLRTGTPVGGALPFALVPESSGETQQGTMSERGFVLGGVSGPQRNLAVMVLELPADPVRLGSTWTLTTDLVSLEVLPPGFRQKDTQQKSEVKLTALTPAADGEQVATLEYELFESVSGLQGVPRPNRRGHAHGHENAPLSVKKAARGAGSAKSAKAAKDTRPPPELSAEVRVSGRGEFLVKAGRWRSWEARMTTRTDGLTLPGMPPGERVLRLTPVEPVPAQLLQRLTAK